MHTLLFSVVMLVFTLMAVAALLYVPYKILHYCIRGIALTTMKTLEVIIPSRR